jgi:polysaccharide export outer membrane protein
MKSLFLALALIDIQVVGMFAQSAPPTDAFQLPKQDKRSSTEDVIRQFEAPESESYRMDNGDDLSINIWGRPELTGKHTIGPDGKITMPLIGSLKLAGKTREESQEFITNALSKYYSDLSVTVSVDRYTSFRIFVLGRVGVPGPIMFDRQPTLLDVLAKAASLPIGGVSTDKSSLVRCAIFRGREQAIWIDLKPLLNEGRLELNIRLARNDVVYLPDANDQLVYVLGFVKLPGGIHLTPTMSLMDALSLAGGPTEDASLKHMVLVRPRSGQKLEIPFNTLLDPKARNNYSLEEGDIVYVPPRLMEKVGYVLQKVSSITGFAVIGTIAKP